MGSIVQRQETKRFEEKYIVSMICFAISFCITFFTTLFLINKGIYDIELLVEWYALPFILPFLMISFTLTYILQMKLHIWRRYPE